MVCPKLDASASLMFRRTGVEKRRALAQGVFPPLAPARNFCKILEHLGGEFGVRLVQAQDDPAHRKPGVDPLPHQRNGLQELRQTLQAKEVRLAKG